jgi:hypothetical protein
LVYVLYYNQDIYKVTAFSAGGGAVASLPAWKSVHPSDYVSGITPMTGNRLNLSGYDLTNYGIIQNSADGGLSMGSRFTGSLGYSISQVKYDLTNRSLGWATIGGDWDTYPNLKAYRTEDSGENWASFNVGDLNALFPHGTYFPNYAYSVVVNGYCVAPAHDNAYAYIAFPILANVAYPDAPPITDRTITHYLQYIVKVAKDGSGYSYVLLDRGALERWYDGGWQVVNTSTGLFNLAETNPTNADQLFLYNQGVGFAVLDFTSATLNEYAPPWNTDAVTDMICTPGGTLVVPSLHYWGTITLYARSSTDGSTWSSVDLTTYLGGSASWNPMIGMSSSGVLFVALTNGKLLFSSDSGATWDATADILPHSTIVDTDAP